MKKMKIIFIVMYETMGVHQFSTKSIYFSGFLKAYDNYFLPSSYDLIAYNQHNTIAGIHDI